MEAVSFSPSDAGRISRSVKWTERRGSDTRGAEVAPWSEGGDNYNFYTYASGKPKVKVTGGVLMRGPGYASITVTDSAELTVADDDYVWLERTAANTWSFNKGSAYPTDKLHYKLAQVAVDGSNNVTVTLTWPGGNLSHANFIHVTLTNTGGSEGGEGTLCTFTYTATAASVDLMTGASPVVSMARIVALAGAQAATQGTVRILQDGSFVLWDCNETQTNEYEESEVTECS